MDLKRIAREILSPALFNRLRALRSGGGTRFCGPYASWQEAAAAATGYDAAEILEKVRASALAVRRGEAAFERDSVRFEEPDPRDARLPFLLRLARANGGNLCVLDFGGSLGSTYSQLRPFLGEITRLRWSVVEQPAFVRCGRQEFETEELRFHDSIEDAAAASPPQLALLSSVLQYLPDPDAIAGRIARAAPAAILVDRTPVHDSPLDAIVVQHVPQSIYRASYPFRIFGRDRLGALFGAGYAAVAELADTPFEALERTQQARYRGLLLEPVAARAATA